MTRRGLKNVRRKRTVVLGQESWTLETTDGTAIPAFARFCSKYLSNPFATRKRYAEALSRFIDYLYETGALRAPISAAQLNAVVSAYPVLLRDGSETTALRVRESGADLWLAETAEALNWAPLAPKSFSNTLAPVNAFLRLSENLAWEARESAEFLGLVYRTGPTDLIEVVTGTESIPTIQVAAIKQNTMFGNVARFASQGIERAKGIRGPKNTSGASRDLDFPRQSIPALIHNANSWRDKSLWLTLAATGLRCSEGRNLLFEDIDLEGQRIYVHDPSGRRPMMADNATRRLRFKGRQTSYTYLIPELKRDLFYAIERYLELEYVPHHKAGTPNYLFQYIEDSRRGQPYVGATDQTLSTNFRRAAKAAGLLVPVGARNWGLQSLRHMYGVYWVNDFPVNAKLGLFGLPLPDVQLMMGHSSMKSTAQYARSKHRRLEARLRASDEAMLGMTEEELAGLPSFNVRLIKK